MIRHPWWQYALGFPMLLAGLPLVLAVKLGEWREKRRAAAGCVLRGKR